MASAEPEPPWLDKGNGWNYPPGVMSAPGEKRGDERVHPSLWPFIAATTVLIALGGGLRLEQHPWAWALRLGDAALLLLYGGALRRRSQCTPTRSISRCPCDTGIIVAGALVAASAAVALLLPLGLVGQATSQSLGLVAKGFVLLSSVRRVTRAGPRGQHEFQLQGLRPVHATLGSFGAAIGIGWALLNLPQAVPAGHPPIAPLDSLFTATSATCVTGLIVRDTPNDFSLFGHLVILCLIQAGGLGIMTFAAVFDVLRRRGLSVRRRLIVQDLASSGEAGDARRLVSGILLFTLVAEVAGAAALWLRWRGETGSFGGDVLLSVFHSISAFCNAGFSLFSTSLESFVGDPAVNAIIGGLIIVGGIGFPVVRTLRRQVALKRRGVRRPLNLHTRLALVTTAWLLLIGFVGMLLLERGVTLRDLSPAQRISAAAFQSLTPRTAGFNTIPIDRLAPPTLLLVILLMFVGASPGSTGGGIKTTTAAILFLIGRAMVSGSDRVPAFGRDIPSAVRHRAVAVGALFGAAVIVGTMLLCVTDGLMLADSLFEVTSGLGTVGLSTGVTPGLSAAGKIIITIAMYVGRVGPLSLALAVQAERTRSAARFPEEHVMVG
jgi:trk system potassium uptake protein TrkH